MILDIGCGFAKNRDSDYKKYKANPKGDVNIDVGFPELKIANYVRCDAHHLCFRNNIFSKVIASHVLEHLQNPFACLVEIKNVLRNNGILEIRVPNKYSEFRGGKCIADPNHIWHWTKKEIYNLVKNYFHKVEVSVSNACWIPIRGNKRLWGKYIIKIFPILATELRVKAWT